MGSGLRDGAPGALAERDRETHATYAAFHSLGLGASHDEMQERERERRAAAAVKKRSAVM